MIEHKRTQMVFLFVQYILIGSFVCKTHKEQNKNKNWFVLMCSKQFSDRSRTEYLELLQGDLCQYFSYNDYLMDQLMKLFPLTELMDFLEASESQRPLTLRTNSLKTRRRDLAQVA